MRISVSPLSIIKRKQARLQRRSGDSEWLCRKAEGEIRVPDCESLVRRIKGAESWVWQTGGGSGIRRQQELKAELDLGEMVALP
ncbi:hypothetical protein Nepgr_005218 [Nepenthes gracilis]|uniref:Uncharacterized protein n=1 Tax=Nepenthes gracilis TaxID=150966 RepID=A0AAD3S2R6_NEPGR|nr:hypothetical protein Nepgr_005218 [Nepenthes gracilis]